MIKKSLVINGVQRILIVEPHETLATVLREHLLLTGCKIGCGEGHCGACNVILDGKVTRSCLLKMEKIRDNAEITTIEGVGTLHDMHPLQVAWMAYGGAQCGFCTPGFIISAKVLLDKNPNPTREEVRDWFNKNRNLCRCTGYKPLIDATMAAAAVMRGEMSKEDLVFKPTGDSIKGTKYIRPSAAQKVTGTWDFGADDALKMPENTLRLALTQATVSHANIKSIDTSEAEKMPGVFRVITYKDILAAGGTNKINGLVMLPKHNKTDGFERPVLCSDKIFQFGDAIAIVAADTEAHARAAADARARRRRKRKPRPPSARARKNLRPQRQRPHRKNLHRRKTCSSRSTSARAASSASSRKSCRTARSKSSRPTVRNTARARCSTARFMTCRRSRPSSAK